MWPIFSSGFYVSAIYPTIPDEPARAGLFGFDWIRCRSMGDVLGVDRGNGLDGTANS